jgi:hypothetical protein
VHTISEQVNEGQFGWINFGSGPLSWRFGRAEFPEDLAEDAESEFGVCSGEAEAVDEAADFFFGGGGGASLLGITRIRFQIATGTERVEQERSETLEIGGCSGNILLWFYGDLWIAREFIEADCDRLAEIHGAMLFASGNSQEPMAMAEVFVRKAALLRAEKEGDTAAGEMLAKEAGGLIQAADGVAQLTLADGGGSDNQCAIFNSFGHGLEFFGTGEQRLGANGGTRLAKSQIIRVHDAKMGEAKVAHGAGSGADVEWISRCYKNYAQTVGIGVG